MADNGGETTQVCCEDPVRCLSPQEECSLEAVWHFLKMIRVTNIEAELKRVKKEAQKEVPTELLKQANKIKDALVDATPVETGFARSRWATELGRNNEGDIQVSITNDAPYIEDLNRGTSQQAPARFIELTLSDQLKQAGDDVIEYE